MLFYWFFFQLYFWLVRDIGLNIVDILKSQMFLIITLKLFMF